MIQIGFLQATGSAVAGSGVGPQAGIHAGFVFYMKSIHMAVLY
jgi:hypothetical protein